MGGEFKDKCESYFAKKEVLDLESGHPSVNAIARFFIKEDDRPNVEPSTSKHRVLSQGYPGYLIHLHRAFKSLSDEYQAVLSLQFGTILLNGKYLQKKHRAAMVGMSQSSFDTLLRKAKNAWRIAENKDYKRCRLVHEDKHEFGVMKVR